MFEEATEEHHACFGRTKALHCRGSNYEVPIEVRPERRTTLGLRC